MTDWDGNERRKNMIDNETLKQYITELQAMTKRHDDALFGSDGRGGIVRDVDRLAQVGRIAAWVITPTTISVVALVVNQFGQLLFGSSP